MDKKSIIIPLFFISFFANAQQWRSRLYPTDWQPNRMDSLGRFLHDFSYAGYKSGLKDLPNIQKNIIDVTKPPYLADNTGNKDVTLTIQKAIDDVGNQGGGVVYFPAGEYKLSVTDTKYALRIKKNNTILRGAGLDKTFLKNVSTNMRLKQLILFEPIGGDWLKPVGKSVKITNDLLLPTLKIPIENTALFKEGDWVMVTTDCTEDFIKEHKSEGMWSTKLRGVRFYRFIKSIDKVKNEIEIDAPTRYFLKKRDNASVFKIGNQLEECGLENLSIGNIQNEKTDLWKDENAFNTEGCGPYEVHGSHLIVFNHALNCWIRNVATYRPKENKDDFHTLSNCLNIVESRFLTIEKCNFQKSQYEGGGGNGYMYTLQGNDCLLKECYAEDGRHNYDFKQMSSNGNVIYKCVSRNPRYSSDFHMHLSMANLFDSFTSDGDYIDARFRPWGVKEAMHSYSTTQSVIWNTKGLKAHSVGYLIESRQWGWGYVIGTSGTTTKVKTTPVTGIHEKLPFDTTPEDFVEGEGKGETLVPQSLYDDQLLKRKQRIKERQ